MHGIVATFIFPSFFGLPTCLLWGQDVLRMGTETLYASIGPITEV